MGTNTGEREYKNDEQKGALQKLKKYEEDHRDVLEAYSKLGRTHVIATFRKIVGEVRYAIQPDKHRILADSADQWGVCCCGTTCWDEYQSLCPCNWKPIPTMTG